MTRSDSDSPKTTFPFPFIEVSGQKALETWTALVAQSKGSPVICDEELIRADYYSRQSAEAALSAAAKVNFPSDLMRGSMAEMGAQQVRMLKLLEANPDMQLPFGALDAGDGRRLNREQLIELLRGGAVAPTVGDWPVEAPEMPALSVVREMGSESYLPKVYIVTLPTDDWTEIPAYLNFGGWNDCPAPEQQVAAFRYWRDRHGARLVALGRDVVNIQVERRPTTRDEALQLAREQYTYCADIVEQGVGSLSALAAALMGSDWWYFWWD